MEVNWEEVEKLVKPSPNYEILVKNIQTVVQYNFVKKYYNLNMGEMQNYTVKLLGSDPRKRYENYLEHLNTTFKKLESLEVENITTFVISLETKEKFEFFIKKYNFSIEEIIRLLKYLFNWYFPSKIYLRELVEKREEKLLEYIITLRKQGIRFTLDILDKGFSKEMRKNIAKRTKVPEDFIFELVNKADFTRMPYIRGSTARHYFGVGYDSLEKLAKADLVQLEEKMKTYLESKGVKLSRSFIELDRGILISGIIPRIVEK
jgi:hypothetical protein